MTETITVICDECETGITKASKIIVKYEDLYIPNLCTELHFCGYEHMRQFFDKKHSQVTPKSTSECIICGQAHPPGAKCNQLAYSFYCATV